MLELKRKVIAGHWSDSKVISKLEDWIGGARLEMKSYTLSQIATT
ncbi:hypothetical protein [Mesotoga sp.]